MSEETERLLVPFLRALWVLAGVACAFGLTVLVPPVGLGIGIVLFVVLLDRGLGIGVRKGSELKPKLDEALASMKADGTVNAVILE